MTRRDRHTSAWRRVGLWGLMTALGVMTALWRQSFVSLADSTGTVIPGSANIRGKAEAGSEIVGSASGGSTVNIRDEVRDASGTLWYQVYVNADTTGYIRADLVEKKDGGTSQGTSGDGAQDGASQSAGSAAGALQDAQEAMDAQYAAVSPETIRVRSTPSTSATVVDKLNKGAQVVVSGRSEGTDAKEWYYVTFTGTDGAEKTGYIRSDLLSLGDLLPPPEEETPMQPEEVPEPEKPVNNDYELTFEQGEDGSFAWYLYNYTEGEHGSKQKLEVLLEAAQKKAEDTQADTKMMVRQRIAIVVLVVLAVLLTIAVIIMAFKLRDVYYEDYEDDEEEGEAQPARRRAPEEEPSDGRRRREQEEGASGARRRRAQEEELTSPRRRRTQEETLPGRRRAEEAGTDANAAPKRKPKNFLIDDDDFEFEFLNMDDKDL